MIKTNDIAKLEAHLGNLVNAKLSLEDIKKIGCPNLIKLFKTGQLSLEYLLFTQQFSEAALSKAQSSYQEDLATCQQLQNSVTKSRQELVNLRADCKLKYATLSTYE